MHKTPGLGARTLGPGLCLLAGLLSLPLYSHAAATLHLAADGQAQVSVMVAANASPRVVAAANELAGMLGRMTGGSFPVVSGEGTNGLAVGVVGDFPLIASGIDPVPDDPLMRERYRLYTHASGAWLIGATESAVEHAVWDFLSRLGYRLYFLTDAWEIVPTLPNAVIALDLLEQPDYHTRQAPRGAPWSNPALWDRWRRRNRIAPAFSLNTGHAYGGIITANAAEFDAHPEYLALVDGERQGTKFCISNPGLRALVVDYAVRVMQANPTRDSISMEPSDGGGWCQCEDCAAMGSISDRVLWLANDVAEAINDLGLGPRFVGFYAYNEHSPPPSIAGHSNVIVSIATSFIRGGYTIEDLVEGWQASGVTIGIREYHDVFAWSHDLPRRARGANLAYLQRTIPYFFQCDARFMNSENSDGWGANGLGYWLTPQMLWEVDNADNLDALLQDFVDKCFGAAASVMGEFYRFLSWDRTLQTDENVIARLYGMLHEAYPLTSDAAARARLDDLVLYTRYVELYYHYRRATGDARQAGFEALLRHVYRMRERYMLSTVAIYDRDRFRDDSVVVPPEADWNVPEPQNPWKDSTPYTETEIADYVDQGMAAFPEDVPDFEPVSFSPHLVSCAPLNPPALPAGSATLTDRGTRRYHLWLEEPRSFDLQVRGGMITHYQDRGNVRVSLSVWLDNRFERVCYDDSVPPDNTTHTISLTSPYAGLHCLEISDGSDQTGIVQPAGIPLTYYTPLDDPEEVPGTWTLYVYVPPRTTVVGGFASSITGRLKDQAGNLVFDFTQMERPGYFSVAVPEGGDGTFWKFESCSGHRILMTIPPCLARTPAELLLPREVVYWQSPEPVFDSPDTFYATGVTQTSAWLTGTLAATGAAPAQVILHWGDLQQERGQVDLGTVDPGAFNVSLTGLGPGTAYYFQAFAWHAFGSAWSEPHWFVTPGMLPFRDDFESLPPGPLHLRNGWQSAPSDAAQVLAASAPGADGLRAAALNAGRVRQYFGESSPATNIVWTDMLLCPSRSVASSPEDVPVLRTLSEDETGTAIFYVDYVTGIVVVYDGREPLPLQHLPRLTSGAWSRFSVRSDYREKTWGLWLNGQKVVDGLDFANSNQTRFVELAFDETALVSTPTLVDDLVVDLEWSGRPPGVTVVDADGDGICDDWERAFFGHLGVATGDDSDADGDGFSDRAEFLAGSDPLDPESHLRISGFGRDRDGGLWFRWPSAGDRSYVLETRSSLVSEEWTPRLLLPATPPTNHCQVPLDPETPAFFRLRLEAYP